MQQNLEWLRRWEPQEKKPKEQQEASAAASTIANMDRTDYETLLREMEHR